MLLYRARIFPWLLDLALRQPAIGRLRAELLGGASGTVLEIGFGTGLSLSHYPSKVRKLYALEPYRPRLLRVTQRVRSAEFPVEFLACDTRPVYPLPDHSVDTVTSMFTLCTVRSVAPVLREIQRVLRPGGRFLFLEHGKAERSVLRWTQHLVTPCWKLVAGGCHFDRPISDLLGEAGLSDLFIERVRVHGLPSIFGRLYRGYGSVPQAQASVNAGSPVLAGFRTNKPRTRGSPFPPDSSNDFR